MPPHIDQQFTLVKASKSRGGGHWSEDDYDVRLGDASGKVIGRIFRSPQSPQDRPWFWTITERVPQWPTDRGYAGSREQAMTAFRLAWDPMPTYDAEASVEWGKRDILGE
jgi:hypothetical protein